jgi:hypothetical protein
MHAGKRPCEPFRRDDATEMQVEGLDAPEDAAGQHSPARLVRHMTRNCLHQYILKRHGSVSTVRPQMHQLAYTALLYPRHEPQRARLVMCQVRPSHRRPRSGITPLVPEGCVDLHNAAIADICKPDCAPIFIIAAMETSLSIY